MFQSGSPNLSHSLPFPSVHKSAVCLCLRSFPENRFINTIFQDSIYTYIYALIYNVCFSLWLTLLYITGPRFIHLTRTGSNTLQVDNMLWRSTLLAAQSCPILCDPMDYSPLGSSVHEIFQARILEWVATSFSRGSSQPRDRTLVSCTAGRFFADWATREAQRKVWYTGTTINLFLFILLQTVVLSYLATSISYQILVINAIHHIFSWETFSPSSF